MSEFLPPSAALESVIARWHRHVRGELPGGLDDLLGDDAVMVSPVVFTPQRGKAIVTMYLDAALATFFGERTADGGSSNGFHYTVEIGSGNTAMLQFETTMGGKHVNGVDIITVDDDARIVEFRVMIRPLQAVNAVHQLMGEMLASMQ